MYSTVPATVTYQTDEDFLTTSFYLSAKDDGNDDGGKNPDKYPSIVNFEITNPPNKILYAINERIDYTGMTVTITYSDGTKHNVEYVCDFDPAPETAFTEDVEAVNVTCAPCIKTHKASNDGGIKYGRWTDNEGYITDIYEDISGKCLACLGSKSSDQFNAAIMRYSDVTEVITDKKRPDPNYTVPFDVDYKNTTGNNVVITKSLVGNKNAKTYLYRADDENKTLSCSSDFGLKEKEVKSINIDRKPSKILYKDNEAISYSGLVVSVTYTDNSTAKIYDYENLLTFSVNEGTGYTTECNDVTVTYHQAETHLFLGSLGADSKVRLSVAQDPKIHINQGAYIRWSNAIINAEFYNGEQTDVTKVCNFLPDINEDSDEFIPFTGEPVNLELTAKTDLVQAYASNFKAKGRPSSSGDWINDQSYSTLVDIYKVTAGKTYMAYGGTAVISISTDLTQGSTEYWLYGTDRGYRVFTCSSDEFVVIPKNNNSDTYLFEKNGNGEFSVEWVKNIDWNVSLTAEKDYIYKVGEKITYKHLKIKAKLYYGSDKDSFMLNPSKCVFYPPEGTVVTKNMPDYIEVEVSCPQWPSVRTDDFAVSIYPLKLQSISVEYSGSNNYAAGEPLLKGGFFTVYAHYGSSEETKTEDVTFDVTCDPPLGTPLEEGMNHCTITYITKGKETATTVYEFTVFERLATELNIQPPTKTIYNYGDALDLTGCKVTATFSDGTTEDVTDNCVFSPAHGDTLKSVNSVEISYTSGNELTGSIPITVKIFSNLTCTKPPVKQEFYIGDIMDYTGIEITAEYSDGTTRVVTDECTFTPEWWSEIKSDAIMITATYTENDLTKIVYLNVPTLREVKFLNAFEHIPGEHISARKYERSNPPPQDYKYDDESRRPIFMCYNKEREITVETPVIGRATLEFYTLGYEAIPPFEIPLSAFYEGNPTKNCKIYSGALGSMFYISPESGLPKEYGKAEFNIKPRTYTVYESGSDSGVVKAHRIESFDPYKLSPKIENVSAYWGVKKHYKAVYDYHPYVYIFEDKLVWFGVIKNYDKVLGDVKALPSEIKNWKSVSYTLGHVSIPQKSTKATFYSAYNPSADIPLDENTKDLLQQYTYINQYYNWGDTTRTYKIAENTSVTLSYLHVVERYGYYVGKMKDNRAYIVFRSDFNAPAVIIIGAEGIDITPPETKFNIGDAVNYSDIKVKMGYSDGTRINIPGSLLTYSLPEGSILSAETSKIITGTYTDSTGKSYSKEFILNFDKLAGLKITSPLKTTYNLGNKFVSEGLKVLAEYYDGTTEDITAEITTALQDGSFIDTDTLPTVWVSYYSDDGESATGTYSIVINKYSELIISKMPAKTDYNIGDTLNYADIEVMLCYTDQSLVYVTDAVSFSPPEGSTVTDDTPSTVTVTYTDELDDSVQNTFEISIERLKQLSVVQMPTKTIYRTGDSLDYSGIMLQAETTGGVMTTLNYGDEGLTFTPTSGTIIASDSDVRITVNYSHNGSSVYTYFNVKIYKLLSLVLTTQPTKIKYHVGEALDFTGSEFTVTNTIESFSTNNVVFNPSEGTVIDTNTNPTITATYTDEYGSSVSTNFDISIGRLNKLTVTQQPTKTRYEIGDNLNYSGIKLLAETTNGIESELNNESEGLSFEPPEGTVIAENIGMEFPVTVTYINKFSASAQTTFILQADKLDSILIISRPAKVEYNLGESLDYTGIEVATISLYGTQTAIDFNDLVFNPARGTIVAIGMSTEITVSYTDEHGITKSSNFQIEIISE